MKLELIKKEDYHVYKDWWEAHGWEPLPQEFLPPLGLVIVNDKNEKICAGWLLQTNANIVIFEWIVSAPKSNKDERRKCIEYLYESACAVVKDMDYALIMQFIMPKKNSLEKIAKNDGWKRTDSGLSLWLRDVRI